MIGFFGGSFDPIHNGHINMALSLMEAHGLKRVLFCPAAANPLKPYSPMQSGEHRLQMVRLAIADIPEFSAYSFELEKLSPSFTVDTLKELKKDHEEIGLLLGSDSIESFLQWKEPEEIISLAKLLIADRNGNMMPANLKAHPHIEKAIELGWTHIPKFDISSTNIRNRLSKSLYCGHLLNKEVLDYIVRHRLYLIP